MSTGVAVTDTATPLLAEVSNSMLDVTKRGALKAGEKVRNIIAREVMGTYSAGKIRSGSRGGLARSFAPSLLETTSGKTSVGVFSDLSYAGIQNRGGIIRPRTRKNLAIPIGDYERNHFVWPRNHPQRNLLQFVKSKRGNKLLAMVDKLGKVDPRYLLVPQVTIRGTRYLDRAKSKSVPVVEEMFGADVKLAVTDAGRKVK